MDTSVTYPAGMLLTPFISFSISSSLVGMLVTPSISLSSSSSLGKSEDDSDKDDEDDDGYWY